MPSGHFPLEVFGTCPTSWPTQEEVERFTSLIWPGIPPEELVGVAGVGGCLDLPPEAAAP